MAFTRLENDIANISKLSNRPNQNDGLSAAQLKGRFDKAGVDIKDYVNEVLIGELESEGGADNIGSTPLVVGGSTTVGGQLGELNTALETKADNVNIYTKTNLNTEGQAIVHWGNLTHVPNLADGHWKTPVADKASLPLSGNELGDNRVVLDDGDGKQAVYTCIAVTGDMPTQWAKIGDVDWNSEEATRVAQENQRVINEGDRERAENNRESAEYLRSVAENSRQSTEALRVTAESSRAIAETGRENTEYLREVAERSRDNAENLRASKESERVQAENARNVHESYNANKGYVLGNKVIYQGSSYLNITPCIGMLPTNTSYWRLIAQKGETGAPGSSLSLKVNRQYDTYEDLPVSADIGYMCLVGLELHIYTESGWVNAGKLTKIDYDLFMHIDGGLFTDESGVEIGESGLEALQNHIIDANTHTNLIVDGLEE